MANPRSVLGNSSPELRYLPPVANTVLGICHRSLPQLFVYKNGSIPTLFNQFYPELYLSQFSTNKLLVNNPLETFNLTSARLLYTLSLSSKTLPPARLNSYYEVQLTKDSHSIDQYCEGNYILTFGAGSVENSNFYKRSTRLQISKRSCPLQ